MRLDKASRKRKDQRRHVELKGPEAERTCRSERTGEERDSRSEKNGVDLSVSMLIYPGGNEQSYPRAERTLAADTASGTGPRLQARRRDDTSAPRGPAIWGRRSISLSSTLSQFT